MLGTAAIDPLDPGRRFAEGRRFPRARALRLLAFALAVWGLPALLPAATFTIDSTLDEVDLTPGDAACLSTPSGVCTLRAAVQEANALAAGAPHTLEVPAGTYTLSIPGRGEGAAATGDLDLTRDDTTINGAGAKLTIIDGGGLDRVFEARTGAFQDYFLTGMTIRNGNPGADNGGGVFNNASRMYFTDVTIRNNTATNGGGIESSGSLLELTNVTITSNTATSTGGGIRSRGFIPETTLINVTISGNTATSGGGIQQDSTFAGSADLTNVTVARNSGQNLTQTAGTITLVNTIVAQSVSGPNCSGTITDGGFNLADDATCGTIPGTLTGLDPTLTDNGGPTSTHALLAGSSAIDTGTNSGCPATDQRGYGRPFNVVCDVGAYEETKSDIAIDKDFSDWTNGIGNEYCVDDEGGADDWSSPSTLDITKFCIASNTVDTVYLLFGFDDFSLSGGNTSTACILIDTDDPPENNADFVICVTLEGPGATQVDNVTLFPCLDTRSDGCDIDPDPLRPPITYSAPSDFEFSNTVAGPFDARDTFLELQFPFSDLELTGGRIVFSSLISYPGNAFLTAAKDSIFGASSQDYDGRIVYDLDGGPASTTPVTLAWLQVEERGSGVRFEWMTATETANVGFNLYAVGEEGLRRLNERIIPSAVIDSLEPQRYSFEAWRVRERSFVLEDVDLFGERRFHGPFVRGEARGTEPEPERVAWGRIRDQRAARAAAWRGRGRGGAPGFARSPGRPGVHWTRPRQRGWARARLEVRETGIYRVSYEQLLAAGVDLTGAPVQSLALTAGGEPVPIRVGEPEGFMPPDDGRRSGGGSTARSPGSSGEAHLPQRPGRRPGGRFGPGAFIEFVGRAQDTLYTRTNVYTLEVDPLRALRVERERQAAAPWASVPASYRERLEVDRDRKYILTAPAEDPWYEAHLLAYGGPASLELTVEVDGYAGGGAALEVELWGLSAFSQDPDHHLELEWNGSWLGEERFDGRRVHRMTAELGHGQLVEGENRLLLTLPGDTGTPWDMVALDRLWLSYARRFVPRQGRLRFAGAGEAFEIVGVRGSEAVAYRMSGAVPVLLEGLSWLRDADGNSRVRIPGIRGPRMGRRGSGAPETVYYFAETGSLLVAGIAPLQTPAELAGSAELLVISHEEFLDGIQPLVDARRAEGWSVAVVDVADVYTRESAGVVDPRALRNFIRFAAAEHETQAVLLVGGDTYDYHDNLGLGSISFIPSLYVATDEVVRYAPVDPLYGDVDGDGVPDVSVGRLPVRTPEELASVVARILEYDEIRFARTALLAADGYDLPAGYSFTAASEEMATGLPRGWELTRAYIDKLGTAKARQRLIQEINAGVALTSYFGHSGPTAWSFDNLFDTADAAALDNPGRPTVVVQWGCWNTYHVTPSYNTLGHKLLLAGDRGAAAVMGATTLTQAEAERKLGKLLFARLGRRGTTLGQALVDAKRELAATEPQRVDVILGWTLLGDPTLVIRP